MNLQIKQLVADEYEFERFCLSLLVTLPDSGPRQDCDPYGQQSLYGTRGQKQYGADFVAQRKDGRWDVGQAKFCSDFTPAKIANAAKAFQDHWESHWRAWKVARLLLFVSCSLQETKMQDKVAKVQKSLDLLDVQIEVWDENRIWKELDARWCLKKEYLSRHPQFQEVFRAVYGQANLELGRRISFFESSFDVEIEKLRSDWTVCPRSEIHSEIDKRIRGAKKIGENEKCVQLLCLKAEILLDAGNEQLPCAKALLAEAKACNPHSTEAAQALESRILQAEGKMLEAIELASKGTTPRSILLTVSLLFELAIEQGHEKRSETLRRADNLLRSPELIRNNDALRLRAVRHLFTEDKDGPYLDKAREEAHRACLSGHAWRNHHIAGIIDYLSALSPALRPNVPPETPSVTLAKFALPGSKEQTHLRNAIDSFRRLAQVAACPPYSMIAKLWLLGSLTLAGRKDEETHSILQEFMQSSEPAPLMLWWVLEIGDEADIKTARQIVEVQYGSQMDDLEWTSLHFHPSVTPRGELTALDSLGKIKQILPPREDREGRWAHQWWTVEMAERFLATDRQDELAALQNEASWDEELQAYLQFLASTTDPNKAAEHLLQSPYCRQNPLAQYDAIQLLRSQKRVAEASCLVPNMVSAIRTEAALRLGAQVAFESKRPECVLEITDAWLRNMTPLPHDILSIRGWALSEIGRWKDALDVAEELANRKDLDITASSHYKAEFACLLFQVGDCQKASIVARDLVSDGKQLPSQNVCLPALQILAHPDSSEHDLAKRLVVRLLGTDLDDEGLLFVYFTGHQLGVTEVSDKIIPMFSEIAMRRPDLMTTGLPEEIIPLMRDLQERSARLWNDYVHARIPVHFLAADTNVPLVRFFHAYPFQVEEDRVYAKASPVLAFHGRLSATYRARPPIEAGSLCADVTALLLAAHLGILEMVEKVLGPIQITAAILPVLDHMDSQAQVRQPDRIAMIGSILQKKDQGRLKVAEMPRLAGEGEKSDRSDWSTLTQAADHMNAFFCPGSGAEEGTGEHQRLLLPREIIALLHKWGVIDQCQRDIAHRATNYLNKTLNNRPTMIDVVSQGDRILTDSLVLQAFAPISGLLDAFCRTFEVHCPQDELHRLENEVRCSEAKEELRKWLSPIRQRIRDSLIGDCAAYVVLPTVHSDSDEDKQQIDLHLLTSMLDLPSDKKVSVWIDDRFFNGFAATQQGYAIVSTLDVLAELRLRRHIDDAAYFQALLKLRRGAFRFVPLFLEEISYHLNVASVQDGKILETRELKDIRISVAATFSSLEILQTNLRECAERSELEVIFSTTQAIVDALCFYAEKSGGADLPRIAWLVESIFYEDCIALSSRIGNEPPQNIELYRVTTAFRLLSGGLRISTADAQSKYLEFVWMTFIEPWTSQSKSLLPAIARICSRQICQQLDSRHDNETSRRMRLLWARWIRNLPTTLSHLVLREKEVLERLPIALVMTINLSGVGICTLPDIISAIQQVIAGRDAQLEIDNGESHVRVISSTDGGIEIEKDNQRRIFNDELILSACHPNPSNWNAFLSEHTSDIERTKSEKEAVLERLQREVDPWERVKAWIGEMESSYRHKLGNLEKMLSNRDSITPDMLTPTSTESMLGFLRIKSTESSLNWTDVWPLCCRRLLEELPPAIVFSRICGVPCHLPNSLTHVLGGLEQSKKEAEIEIIKSCVVTPFEQFHFISLISSIYESSQSDEWESLFLWFVEEDARNFQRYFHSQEVLDCLIRLSLESIRREKEVSDSIALGLAWIHANQVLSVLVRQRIDLASILAKLKEWCLQRIMPRFSEDPLASDIANPTHVSSWEIFARQILTGAGDQLSSLSISVKEPLVNLLLPGLIFIRDRDTRGCANVLGSFLLEDQERLLSLLDPAFGALATQESRKERLSAALKDLSVNPGNKNALVSLFFLTGTSTPGTDHWPTITSIASQLKPVSSEDITFLGQLCHWARDIRMLEPRVLSWLEESICRIAEKKDVVGPAVEALARMLCRASPGSERLAIYCRIIRRLADANSETACNLVPLILNVAMHNSPLDASMLYGLLAYVRARADLV